MPDEYRELQMEDKEEEHLEKGGSLTESKWTSKRLTVWRIAAELSEYNEDSNEQLLI